MKVSGMIHLGDRVEIRLLQDVRHIGRSGEGVKVHISKVLDIRKDGSLEMAMPSEGGRMVPLQLGVRYEMIFSSNTGMCQAIGHVKGRYKKGNLYLILVELASQPEKLSQRREFFRYKCSLEVFYYLITEEEAELESGDAVFIRVRGRVPVRAELIGQFADLSGGGGRLVADSEIEEGQHLLVGLHLESEKIDKQYYLIAKVVKSAPLKDSKGKYESHIKFLLRDNKISEEIVRYIFEMERLDRKRERE